MQNTFFSWKNNVLLLHVVIQPGASKDEITGLHNGRLKICLKAPPVDGKANQYLIQYLARFFKLPKKCIQLTKGQNNRLKTLHIASLTDLPPLLLSLTQQ